MDASGAMLIMAMCSLLILPTMTASSGATLLYLLLDAMSALLSRHGQGTSRCVLLFALVQERATACCFRQASLRCRALPAGVALPAAVLTVLPLVSMEEESQPVALVHTPEVWATSGGRSTSGATMLSRRLLHYAATARDLAAPHRTTLRCTSPHFTALHRTIPLHCRL